jgi:hypothetical protein
MEKGTHQRLQILGTDEFFPQLEADIDDAQNSLLFINHIWRADETGLALLHKIRKAAERSVKAVIFKDTAGEFNEFSEDDGCSAFQTGTHSLPTRIAAVFHNAILGYPETPTPADIKAITREIRELISHPNIELFQDSFYDHTKGIVIDKRISFVGGINHENREKQWIDFMLRMDDEALSMQLLRSWTYTDTQKDRSGKIKILHGRQIIDKKNNKNATIQFIEETEVNLFILMAFLDDCDEVQAIIDLVNNKRKPVHLVVSIETINIEKLEILRRLSAATGFSPLLTLSITSRVLHAKTMIRDNKTLWIGSKNMLGICDLIDETVVIVDDVPVDLEALFNLFDEPHHTMTGANLRGLKHYGMTPVYEIAFERLAKRIFRIATRAKSWNIERARTQRREYIQKHFLT